MQQTNGSSLKPFLLKMGVTSEEEYERLQQEAQIEMYLPDFAAAYYMLTVWGNKPASSGDEKV